MRSVLIAFIIFVVNGSSVYAANNSSLLGLDLSTWIASMQGAIDTADGNTGTIILPDTKVFNGMEFLVTRAGDTLTNPVTGVVIGRKMIELGLATVISVDGDVVTVKLNDDSRVLSSGDLLRVATPINIDINYESLSASKQELLTASLFTSVNIAGSKLATEVDTDSRYTLGCASVGGDVGCIFKFDDNIIFQEHIIGLTSLSVDKLGADSFHKLLSSFKSIAIGNPYGSDNNVYVALADDSDVSIYMYDIATNALTLVEEIKHDFNTIVSVELVDINGNGRDELFISNVDKNVSSSYILEHDGSQFSVLSRTIDKLFRAYYSNGKKMLTAQIYSTGGFTGRINSVSYSGGYQYTPMKDGLGLRLYGFGLYPMDNNKQGVIGFSENGNFTVNGVVYPDTYFGDTSKKLLYSYEVQVRTEALASGDEVPVYDTRVKGLTVYQRIIELSDSRFFFASNVPIERKAVGLDEYTNSYTGLYMFYNDNINVIEGSELDIPTTIYCGDITTLANGENVIAILSSDIDDSYKAGSGVTFMKVNNK